MRYNLQQQPQYSTPRNDPGPKKPKRTGYERYQDPGFIPEIQAKSSVWGSKAERQGEDEAQPELISTARKDAGTRRVMTLEEVEAAMRSQSQPAPPLQPPQYRYSPQPPLGYYPPATQPLMHGSQLQSPPVLPQAPQPDHGHFPDPSQRHSRMPSQPAALHPPTPTFQILQNPNRAQHSPKPSQDQPLPILSPPVGSAAIPGRLPIITNPQQLMDLSEEQRRAYLDEDAKRAKRNHKIFLLSKGNGLMTPHDKNFISRIQLQQLVTATGSSNDPNPEAALSEDFYYQVYSQIRGAPRQHPTQPLGHFAQTYLFQTGGRVNNRRNNVGGDNHMQRMQQQVQRAVEAAKLKPKNKQLIIEGSLGKISFSNAKTPKPLLNVKRPENVDSKPATGKKMPHLISPSDRKTTLKNIEGVYIILMALEDHERREPPPPVEDNPDTAHGHMEWSREKESLIKALWSNLKVMDPIVTGSQTPHPFIAILSFGKGKRVIPRVFRQISSDQQVTLLTMIVVHLDQLDVVHDARVAPGETQPAPAVREEIELFSHAVMPCLLGYVSEAPINIVAGLLGLLIDHCNVLNVARTKIGLGIMIMLLSRAELVKQAGQVSDQEWNQWTGLYNRLFDFLEPSLDGIFTGPVNSGDDVHVWQFLAAMGVGASPEQQQRLVIAVKDRVMDTVSHSKTLPPDMSTQRLANVNLFMTAIGLDVSML